MELYIHIPFCVRKCRYCDFLSFSAGIYDRKKYVDQLIREIKSINYQRKFQQGNNAFCMKNLSGRLVETIFIGGGTPSLLEASEIECILDAVRQVFKVKSDAEITMEANPGTLTKESAVGYRKAGINRLSLGLQSASDEELKFLGRIHTKEQFLESYFAARGAGFENINVDLMSALPGQSERSWQDTLDFVCNLGPEHISAYSLIVEEGTQLYEEYGQMCEDLEKYGDYESMPQGLKRQYEGKKRLPDEKTDRNMYHYTKKILAECGYERYEISNYSKAGYSCRHNIGYWMGEEYLGFGLGASSLIEGRRFHVTSDFERYMTFEYKDFASGLQYEEIQNLSVKEKIEEFMFLGLRLTGGVNSREFERRFGKSLESVYGKVLEKLSDDGLIEFSYKNDAARVAEKKDNIRLTEYGLDVSTYALAEFLL